MQTKKHIYVDNIRNYIEERGYTDFALVKSDEFQEDVWFISPIIFSPNMITREGSIFDNTNIYGEVVMTKEEMMLKFQMYFGHTIDYLWDNEIGVKKLEKV